MSFFPLGVHVNVIWDPTVGVLAHTLWGPPPVPPPLPGTPVPSIEMIATQMWTVGYLMGANKFTTTVKHKNVFICIDAHDLGPMIPDVTIPPINAWYAIMWPFSSRKMTFMCATVHMNGKPTSCSQIFPPMPMMTCGDPVSAPTAFPIINLLNNVTVGMTLADFLSGLVKIVVSMAIDAIFEWVPLPKFLGKLGKKLSGKITKVGGRALAAATRTARKVVSKVGDKIGKKASVFVEEGLKKLGLHPATIAKKAVTALAGWGTSAIDGNPTLAYKVGGGLLPEVGVQVGGDAKDVSGGTVGGVPVGVVSGNTPSFDGFKVK